MNDCFLPIDCYKTLDSKIKALVHGFGVIIIVNPISGLDNTDSVSLQPHHVENQFSYDH